MTWRVATLQKLGPQKRRKWRMFHPAVVADVGRAGTGKLVNEDQRVETNSFHSLSFVRRVVTVVVE